MAGHSDPSFALMLGEHKRAFRRDVTLRLKLYAEAGGVGLDGPSSPTSATLTDLAAVRTAGRAEQPASGAAGEAGVRIEALVYTVTHADLLAKLAGTSLEGVDLRQMASAVGVGGGEATIEDTELDLDAGSGELASQRMVSEIRQAIDGKAWDFVVVVHEAR